MAEGEGGVIGKFEAGGQDKADRTHTFDFRSNPVDIFSALPSSLSDGPVITPPPALSIVVPLAPQGVGMLFTINIQFDGARSFHRLGAPMDQRI